MVRWGAAIEDGVQSQRGLDGNVNHAESLELQVSFFFHTLFFTDIGI